MTTYFCTVCYALFKYEQKHQSSNPENKEQHINSWYPASELYEKKC